MIDDAEMLARVEGFLAKTGMKPTPFGQAAAREGGLVKSMRRGRSLTLRKAQQILQFMDQYERSCS